MKHSLIPLLGLALRRLLPFSVADISLSGFSNKSSNHSAAAPASFSSGNLW